MNKDITISMNDRNAEPYPNRISNQIARKIRNPNPKQNSINVDILSNKNLSKGKKKSTDTRKEESKLVKSIREIFDSKERPPKRSIFKFINTKEAAIHNGKILESCNFNYEEVLTKQKGTNIHYGSEFRKVDSLNSLFQHHKDWTRLKSFLLNGTDTSFLPIEETKLKDDCTENIRRGNHQSSSRSSEEIEFVNKQYNKEVKKGWMIPIPIDSLYKMKSVCVIPVGVVSQFTINEKGETIKKMRLTHDCSWEGPSSYSVNNRINEELLPPLQYGRCLLRVLHSLQYLRHKNPNKRILMAKHDLDSAYRRFHWHAKCALLCMTIVANIAYLLTRLCFGIASGPSEWCLVSETVVDFANALMRDETWDPIDLHNPHEDIPTNIEYSDDSIKLKQVKNIIFNDMDLEDSYIDGYIDDLLTLILETNRLIQRGIHVIPLILYILFRPVHEDEPISRSDILSKAKLIAEGMLAERKTFLGWIIDSRQMRVFLPKLKTLRWINEIDSILSSERVKSKQLESVIGKLNHAAFIIPLSRYFLNRIRHTDKLAKKYGPQKLSNGTRNDLELFKDFLSIMSDKGTAIENVTHSIPDIFCWSDACEYGLGGFDNEGNAWQWEIPLHLQGKISINLLEFISSVVTIQLSLKDKNKNKKVFALTDNSSALGWLHKASFHPAEKNKHDQVARYFANFMIKNEHSLYANHIKGELNNVADSLSREFNFSTQQLTDLLYITFTEQMPPNFRIQRIPEETSSWIMSILESLTIGTEPKPNSNKKRIRTGESGETFVQKLGSKTNFLETFRKIKNSRSFVPSQQLSEEMFLEKQRKHYCTAKLSEIPSDTFVRSSGLTVSKIQELTKLEQRV